MKSILYTSPFVPPEWIAAHGLRPLRRLPAPVGGGWSLREGQCPFARAFAAGAGATVADAVVFTTTCDQMRRAGTSGGLDLPAFVLNVPATWQTPAARRLYADELSRLGRFMCGLGGRSPGDAELAAIVQAYQAARAALLESRQSLNGRRFVERLLAIGSARPEELAPRRPGDARGNGPAGDAIPVAVLGGGLTLEDLGALDIIERLGGRIVVNGLEVGERCLPAMPLDAPCSPKPSALAALAEAYMAIPDAFRRPDDLLHQWLAAGLGGGMVRGLIILRQVWCDMWHAQVARIRQASPTPVLDVDISCAPAAGAAVEGRIQAFLEILR